MDASTLKIVGQVAGIGGLALGVLLIVFKEVIRKNIFPQLTKEQAYNLLNSIIRYTFIVSVTGIAAWTYAATRPDSKTHEIVFQGYVKESGTTTPVAGAKIVVVNRPDIGSKYTDEQGFFAIRIETSVDRIPARVQVTHSDYEDWDQTRVLTSEVENISLIRKSHEYELSGRVLNSNNRVLAGLVLEVDGKRVVTDDEGRFNIKVKGTPDMRVLLHVFRNGERIWNDYVEIKQGSIITID